MLGFAEQEWMFYAFFVVQALGFVSGAALQGYMSAQVPANEQGELQGATGSVMSLTGIIGPLLMLNLFSFYTAKEAPLYIPGIPYFAAAALTFTAALIFLSIQRNLRLKAEAGLK
jgi:DHA1 family tetracycline resistance protein-like MFS transporter